MKKAMVTTLTKEPLKFVKMHVHGNDFMIVDTRFDNCITLKPEYVTQLSDRHKGIGFDQLLIIKESNNASVLMEIYNADGSSAVNCGNGACCVAWLCMNRMYQTVKKFVGNNLEAQTKSSIRRTTRIPIQHFEWCPDAHRNDEPTNFSRFGTQQHVTIQISDRILHAQRISDDIISVDLGKPEFDTELTKRLQREMPATFVSIGNPHIVIESNDSCQAILQRVNKFFPDGVNIEWLRIIDNTHISIRIFERGVGFTRACGTGACAAAAVAVSKGYCGQSVNVSMEEGDVYIHFDKSIVLHEHVTFVFEGKIDYIPTCVV